LAPRARQSGPRWPKSPPLMTSLTKKPHPPSKKKIFRVQTRRLAASFETYRVCRAYRTGEIPAQSHVRLGVFFLENPRKRPDAKEFCSLDINTFFNELCFVTNTNIYDYFHTSSNTLIARVIE